MTVYSPFQPKQGANLIADAIAGSASLTLEGNNKSIRFVNQGANICYVRVGAVGQVATINDTPILSGESLIIEKAEDNNTVAFISPSGATLNIQQGEGGY